MTDIPAALPQMIGALQVTDLSGPAGLRWSQIPPPVPAGELLVDVVAAGVSFADLGAL